MKSFHYIFLAAAAVAATACSDKSISGGNELVPGGDVRFVACLSDASGSRTIYGPENADGKAWPVYWVTGDDKIFNMSSACLNNRNTATYVITAENTESKIATGLTHVGDAGLQWKSEADAATGDFYSIYPASMVTEGGANVAASTVICDLASYQDPKEIIKDAHGNYELVANMDYAFMTASTRGVQNGAEVDLQFVPRATVLDLTLQGPDLAGESTYITSISIRSINNAQPISGNFTVDFANPDSDGNPTITSALDEGAQPYILMSTYDANDQAIKLDYQKTLKCKFFLIPNTEVNDISNLQIEVTALTQPTGQTDLYNHTFTMALKPASGLNGGLVAGQIHKLPTLPALTLRRPYTFNYATWMSQIPKNVYLSQISVPGSWYSYNNTGNISGLASTEQYQSADIEAQYAAGARAFHFDLRSTYTFNNAFQAANINNFNDEHFDKLVLAGSGGDWQKGLYTYWSGGVLFTRAIRTLADKIQGNKDAYIVVVLTLALQSEAANQVYALAQQNWIRRANARLEQLKNGEIKDDNGNPLPAVTNIVGFNGETITENTVLGDVAGKVLIVFDLRQEAEVAPSSGLYGLVTRAVSPSQGQYGSSDIWFGGLNASSQALQFRFSQRAEMSSSGSGTQTAPTLANRRAALSSLLTYSENNAHALDNIYLFGIGGFANVSTGLITSQDQPWWVTRRMNPWFYNRVVEYTSQGRTVPLGTVLMNDVNSTTKYNENGDEDASGSSSQDLIRHIININTLVRLKADPNWDHPAYETAEASKASYSSAHSNGGDAWTIE